MTSSSITAVVLSAAAYERTFEGIEVLVHRSVIRSPLQLLEARFAALAKVKTSHFFFLDDDDDLPPDYLDVLTDCLAKRVAMAYTDELVISYATGTRLQRARGYSQAAHLGNAFLAHHLVLCRTVDAQVAAARLPRGHLCPEFLLYWELAKAGAAYVPRVGYVWKPSRNGMHRWQSTVLSVARALWWAKRDLSLSHFLEQADEFISSRELAERGGLLVDGGRLAELYKYVVELREGRDQLEGAH